MFSGNPQVAAAGDNCTLSEGTLSVSELPDGSSAIECDAIGRVVTYDGVGVTVPQPGMAVGIESLTTSGDNHGFTLEVALDGTVSYDLTEAGVDTSVAGVDVPDDLSDVRKTPDDVTEEAENADADPEDVPKEEDVPVEDVDDVSASTASACNDGAYTTNDLKEYGTYNWYIGDGGMPGGLSRTNAKWAFYDAIDNITKGHNNCGYRDGIPAKSNFLD